MIDTTFEMMNKDRHMLELFAQCSPGLEKLLSREIAIIASCPTQRIQKIQGGVSLEGDMRTMARINLHSTLATKLMVRIKTFPVHHLAQLDKRSSKINWEPWIKSGTRVSINATCSRSRIYHSKAAAQRVENAVHQSVSAQICSKTQQPDLMIHVRIHRDLCTISLNSSGQPLWQRGEKREISAAPIRANLAAAALQLAHYRPGQFLFDPMCGSGTILMEAATAIAARPSGLGRAFAFEKWPIFKKEILEKELNKVHDRIPGDNSIRVFGSDLSPGAVGMTRRNLKRAGLENLVELEQGDLADASAPASRGIWISNPPYGKRLNANAQMQNLYQVIGRVYKKRFSKWRLVLFCPDPKLIAATGLGMNQIGPAMAHGGLRVRVYQTGPLDGQTR